MYREALATGAVISGRRTFELARRWNGDHHDGVPILVLTHHIDESDAPPGSSAFYTDVAACAADARAAAGDSPVLVHGAGAAQALLDAGELDEMEIHLVPVLLGSGRRLFDLVGVLSAHTLKQHQGGRPLTSLARRHQRGSVAPQRLDAPRPSLSPEELSADEPVRERAARERAEPLHEVPVAARVHFGADRRQER